MEERYVFKAKEFSTEEWVQGYYAVIKGKPVIISKEPEEFFYPATMEKRKGHVVTEVRPETICQCTGLQDEKGTLIWENDVIKYHFGNEYAQIRYGAYQSCFDSQKAEHIGFYVDWSESRNYRKDLGYWINMVNAKVVGNIFDNPELLESEE